MFEHIAYEHTFDWKVNNVKPRNTPRVISLYQSLSVLDMTATSYGYAQRLHDDDIIKECDGDAECECLHYCESREQNKV
jgi:hypothetical protein